MEKKPFKIETIEEFLARGGKIIKVAYENAYDFNKKNYASEKYKADKIRKFLKKREKYD